MNYRFQDRAEAGVVLGGKLKHYAGKPGVVVLGLARGGVLVAAKVAQTLGVPMDVFLVRKLGAPGHEEFAMGAIASGGVCFLQEETIRALGISGEYVNSIVTREKEELTRREKVYREGRPPISVNGKAVILVDDGLATGASMRAAVMAVCALNPSRIVVAVPVAAGDICSEFECIVDELVCVEMPYPFFAVGEWYEAFGQVSDEEVKMALKEELAYEINRSS